MKKKLFLFCLGIGKFSSVDKTYFQINRHSERRIRRAVDVECAAHKSNIRRRIRWSEEMFQRGTRSYAVGLPAVHCQCRKALISQVRTEKKIYSGFFLSDQSNFCSQNVPSWSKL